MSYIARSSAFRVMLNIISQRVRKRITEMTTEEVFQRIAAGTMTFAEFEEWQSDQRQTAYEDGAAQQAYEAATC